MLHPGDMEGLFSNIRVFLNCPTHTVIIDLFPVFIEDCVILSIPDVIS